MASDLAAKIRKTTEDFLKSFEGNWPADATLSQRAPECEHIMLPTCLGRSPMNTEQFKAHIERIAHHFTESKVTIEEYLGVPEERRSVCMMSLDAMSPVGPYHNEYVWFFWFDESGEKIVKIKEFLDAISSTKVSSAMREQGFIKDHVFKPQ